MILTIKNNCSIQCGRNILSFFLKNSNEYVCVCVSECCLFVYVCSGKKLPRSGDEFEQMLDVSTGVSQLVINQTMIEDEGEYTCYAQQLPPNTSSSSNTTTPLSPLSQHNSQNGMPVGSTTASASAYLVVLG